MSGLRITAAVLPSLSPSPGGDTDRDSSDVNAAFNGVLARIAGRSATSDSTSSKDRVGFGSSAKGARSDPGASGSDEPEADATEDTPAASMHALAGTATLDISALARAAALMPTGSATTATPQAAEPSTTPDAGRAASSLGSSQGTVPTASPAAAPQSSPSIPSTAISSGAPIAGPDVAVRSEPLSGSTATRLSPTGAVPTGIAGGSPTVPSAAKDAGTGSGPAVAMSAKTATDDLAPKASSEVGSGVGTVQTDSHAGANSNPAVAMSAKTVADDLAPKAPSEDVSGVGTVQTGSRAGTNSNPVDPLTSRPDTSGAAQSSQPATDAAQAAAAVLSQPLQNTAPLQASAPLTAAVRPPAPSGPRPAAARPLRAGTESLATAPATADTATPTLSALSTAAGRRGKDKTATASVASAATDNNPSVVATPAQQVLTALQSLGKDAAGTATRRAGTATTASADGTNPQTTGNSGLKSLTITLNPAHLGPVSITMRLLADTVDIRIAVSNPDTLHLLDRDKHLLAAAVEAMGGSRDTFQIGGPAQTSGSGDSASTGGQSQNSPGRQDAASSDTSSNGRQSQGQGRSTLPDTRSSDADDPTSTSPLPLARGLDGSLYL